MSAQSTISSSTEPKDGITPQLPAQPAKATQPKKRYQYKKDQLAKGDNLLEHLLAIRGIEGEDRDIFLSPDFETNVHDPFLLKDMQKVVDRILSAIEAGEKILIYSDYDADGLPGAAIAHDFFTTLGYEHVAYITPDRHVDGFGVHSHIARTYIEEGYTLIITIDCGIADSAVAAEIKQLYPQVDIIISDHHLPGAVLPDVFAIINPKQADCMYPEKMLCGAAVMWKIVHAIILHMRETGHTSSAQFKNGYEKWLLDLAGMATLSDMVPLRGENRVLAYYGLIVLRKTKRPGLQALCTTNNLELYNIVEEDITFTLSPRINVASRLAEPKLAFNLLTAKNYDDAVLIAKELNQINTKRKTMVAQTVKQAMKLISEKYPDTSKVPLLVLGNPDWKPPILGLVATHITKHIPKPVWVWGRSDDGVLKGSIRSVEGFDVVEIMSHTPSELFINKGGHAMSGGFAIDSDCIHNLEKELVCAYEKVHGVHEPLAHSSINEHGENQGEFYTEQGISQEIEKTYYIDAELQPVDIHSGTYGIISKLAPFGVDNEKPLFAITGVSIKGMKFFGKTKEHLEVDCGNFKAIQFFSTYAEDQFEDMKKKAKVTLIGHIEKNQFRGATDIRLRLVDIV
ncbi:MAG: single-stranded-DNA-specific exonuclease, single-stranded-DNA-specific exonuclease [Candidatus Parcubacteria bacterium]|jgi:single-stranded-DNA-specific exonuclease